MQVHALHNVHAVIQFLRRRRVSIGSIIPARKINACHVNMSEIVDGDKKILLGLVWTLILHYDIRTLHFKGS